MIYYSAFYFYVIVLGLCFNLYRNKIFLLAMLLGAIFFSGFRYDAGNDFFSYMDMLTGVKSYDRIEVLTAKLIELSSFLGSPSIFYFTTSFLYVSIISYSLYRSKALGFTSILLLLFFAVSWLSSFGYVRQYVAISFFFLGFVFLLEHKYLNYLLFTVVACLFHKSAVVSFAAVAFYVVFARKERSAICYLSFLVLAFLSKEFLIVIINYIGLFTQYIDFSINKFGFGIFLALLFVLTVNTAVAKFFRVGDKSFWLYNNMFFCGVLLYASLLNFGEYVVRVAYYFVPFFYASSFFLINKLGRISKLCMLLFYIFVSTFTYYYTLYLASVNATKDFLTNYKFIILL